MPTTFYKRSAAGTTALNLNTAWDSASAGGAGPFGPPADINNDIAQWDATSLGAALTGAFTANQIIVNGAAGAIAHGTGTTITLGTGGFTQALTNNQTWTESGTIAVGSTTQTWSLYNSAGATPATAITLNASSSLTGTSAAVINVVNTGTTQANATLGITGSTTSAYAGKLVFGENTQLQFGTGSSLASATVQVGASGVVIRSAAASGNTLTLAALLVDNDLSLGTSGSSVFTITAPVTLGGTGTRTLNIVNTGGGTTFAGSLLGSNNLAIAGGGGYVGFTGSLAGFTGNLSIGTGTQFQINTSSNYTYDGSITGAGTLRKLTGTGVVTLTNSDISVTTITNDAGTFAFSTNGTQIVSSAVGGAGSITKSGTGTTTFRGGGNSSGGWTINANSGTLEVTTAALSNGSGAITVNGGSTLTSDASGSIAKPITANADSTVILNGATTGLLTINTRNFTLAGTATTTWPATSYVSSVASAVGSLTIDGNRVISLPNVATVVMGAVANGTAGAMSTAAIIQKGGVIGKPSSSGTVYLSNNSVTSNMYQYGYYRGTGGAFGDATRAGKPTYFIPQGVFDINGVTVSSTYVNAFWVGYANDSGGQLILRSSASFGNSSGTTGLSIGYSTETNAVTQLVVTGATTTVTTPGYVSFLGGSGSRSVGVVTAGATLSMATLNFASTLATSGLHLKDGATLVVTTGTTGAVAPISLFGNDNKISAGTGSIVFPNVIQDAPGRGIESVTVGSAGVGYVGAPRVVVSSGDAIITADWDEATKTITGYTIHSPGTSYGATPTITLVGGGFSTAATAPTVTLNASNTTDGSITKVNTGTVFLTGANTNTGTYRVTAGTLKIGNGGTTGSLGLNDESDVIIESGATLTFNRTDASPLTYSGVFSGAGTLSKEQSSTVILSADNNGLTGPVTISASGGAIRATHGNALGTGAGAVTVNNNSALELANNITLARNATITGSGVASGGALRNVSGNNTIGTVALGGSATIVCDVANDTLTITSSNAFTGAANTLTFNGAGNIDNNQPIQTGTGTVTKQGTGTTILRATNSSYTGTTAVNAGFLGFTSSVLSSGGNSSFGNTTLAANLTIAANAGIRYYGSGTATFSRGYTFQGAAGSTNYLESNGTGAVTFSTPPTYATTSVAKTLGLGGTGTAGNTINYVIANNVGANAVGVTKDGTGKWVLGANNTATGAYAVNAGTLVLQGTNTPASVTVSNSNTVLVLESDTGAPRTGTATVTVNAGAKIQTLTGTTQKGQHTYSALTFAANARIRIGG